MKTNHLTAIFIGCLFTFFSHHTYAATHTFDWIGSTQAGGIYPWSLATNWSETGGTGDIPGSAATDIVRIGTNLAFINQPTLTASATVASLTFGSLLSTSLGIITVGGLPYAYFGYNPVTLTVTGSGVVLTTGSITEDHTVGILSDYTSFQTTLAGTGSIVCTGDFTVGNTSVTPPLASTNATVLSTTITQLTIDGNLIYNARGDGSGNKAISYPYFSLDANHCTLLGQMEFVSGNSPGNNQASNINANYHYEAGFCMDTYSTPTTLELLNAVPIVTNNYLAIDFTNNGGAGTVLYDDPLSTDVQTVYTTNSTSVGTLPYNYIYLTFAGASTKKPVGGVLTIGGNWTSGGTGTADLTNNPNITVTGSWNNTTNVTCAAGTITIGGNMTNATGIASLSTGSVTIGGSMTITSGTVKGSTSSGTTTVGGALINSSTLTCNAETMTFGSGINNAIINAGSSTLLFNGTYQNNSPGVFTCSSGTVNIMGAYTNASGASLINGSGSLDFSANYTNSGTFTASTGMVYFSGASPALLDNSTQGTLFNNVTFNGSGTAAITAGTGNFAVSASSSLYMVSPAQLVAGSTTAGGACYLTVMSNATSTATVYTPSGTTITGNVNVQRYISSGTGTRGYRLLSSPVNVSLNTAGAGNLGLTYLNASASFGGTTYNGAFTEGPGTGFSTNGSVNPIIYLYDESRPTDNSSYVAGKNIGIYSVTGAAGAPAYGITTLGGKPAVMAAGVSIPVGNSYLFYFVGSNQSTVVSASRVPDATTLTATGYLNQGTSVLVKFWKTGSATVPYDVTTGTTNYGFNQVGNPYASTIDLAKLYSDNYNAGSNPISPSFYELLPGGNYVSYNASNGATSDSRASKYIVSGQGFLMKAGSASPAETLTFKEDQKVAYPSGFTSSTTPEMMLDVNPGPALVGSHAHNLNSIPVGRANALLMDTTAHYSGGLHLQLSKDSIDYAQTGIYFGANASDKYGQPEDAVQVDGGTADVFLSSYSSDSVKLSINTLSNYTLGKRIRLYAGANHSGVYTMSIADITAIDTANYSISLVDNLQNDSVDMVHYKTYSFNMNTADTNSFGSGRFVLVIGHKPVPQYFLSNFSGQKVSSGVQLNWTVVNAGNYTGYTLQKLNADGAYDSLYSIQSDTGVTAYRFIDIHPVTGNNIYRLKQNGFSGGVTYSAAITVGYNSTTPNGALTLYPNPSKGNMNASLASNSTYSPTYTADIFSTDGKLVKHEPVNASTWTENIADYRLGVYIMQIKDRNGNIIGQSKFVKIN